MIIFSGKVRDLTAYLMERTYPGKVISLERYKKKKPPGKQRRSYGGKGKVFVFSIPDSIA